MHFKNQEFSSTGLWSLIYHQQHCKRIMTMNSFYFLQNYLFINFVFSAVDWWKHHCFLGQGKYLIHPGKARDFMIQEIILFGNWLSEFESSLVIIGHMMSFLGAHESLGFQIPWFVFFISPNVLCQPPNEKMRMNWSTIKTGMMRIPWAVEISRGNILLGWWKGGSS